MGVFDEVMVICPSCGSPNDLQSKAGPCRMARFKITDAPPEVLADIAGNHWCHHCDYVFEVKSIVTAFVG